jgi:Flp pilus assembly protein TadD
VEPPPAGVKFREIWLSGLLVVAVLVVSFPVLQAGFSPWDDRIYTADNPLVREGLSWTSIRTALTSSWENNWCPVFWTALAAQVSVAGVHPSVFHAVSVFLAALNVLLLWQACRKFGITPFAAAVAVAWWALHPLRVETVAWISAQKHLWAAAFLLGSILLYPRAGGSRLPSLLLYALSVMASQAGVGLPVFLVCWQVLARRGWWFALRSTAPFFGVAMAAAAAALFVNWNASAQVVPWFDFPWPRRLLQAAASFGWWTWRTVWPSGLAASYPWPAGEVGFLSGLGIVAGVLCVLAAWHFRSQCWLITAGLAGFLAGFFPVSGLLAMPIPFTADRLTYIPCLFLALSVGAALDCLSWRRSVAGPIAAAGILVFGGLTFRQAGFWKTETAIVERTLALYPDSVPARINAAVLLSQDSRWTEALEILQEIRTSDPKIVTVWLNEMIALKSLGRTSDLVKTGAQAVSAIPNSPDLRLQYAWILEEAGRPAEALAEFRAARELDPMSVQTTFQLARALVSGGEVKEAIPLLELLEASLRSRPDYWQVRHQAHDANGDWEKAKRAREAAEALQGRAKGSP